MLNKPSNEILQALKKVNAEEKSKILLDIQETQDVSLVSPLVNMLEEESSRTIKERILMILDRLIPLAEINNVSVDQDIEKMMRSTDAFIRNGIVEIIKRSEMPIVQFLEKLAEDPDKDVRKFVIDSLCREKSEKGMTIIRNRLNDPEINISYTAIEYLGNFKDEKSVDTIENLAITSDNLMVICTSLEALAKIGISPQKKKIFEIYMQKDINPVLVFPILKYLGTFGTPDVFPYIEYILSTNSETLTKEIIDAIEGIVKFNHLKTLPEGIRRKLEALHQNISNSVDKYAITKLLVKTSVDDPQKSKKQLKTIRQMLLEKNDMAKLCAIEVLADIGNKSDIQRLEDMAEHIESDELLEAIGDAVAKIYQRL